jgi:hypothetical protein
MKSLILEHVRSLCEAERALDEILPGQRHPWILQAARDDVLAYFHVERDLDGAPNLNVTADISGRHVNDESTVIASLKQVQSRIGGAIVRSP